MVMLDEALLGAATDRAASAGAAGPATPGRRSARSTTGSGSPRRVGASVLVAPPSAVLG